MSAPSLPLTVVGGYLGAGKTTLVNRLLANARGRRLAVVVNDFGELAIDAALVRSRTANVVHLAGGCACCSYGDDLVAAVAALAREASRYDRVLVETSGVSLPAPVSSAAALVPGVRVDGIVVVADAETVRARAADRFVGETILRQLEQAHLILLNKADLVSGRELEHLCAWISAVAPFARCVPATYGNGADTPPLLDRWPAARPRVSTHDLRDHDVASFRCDGPVDVASLGAALAGDRYGVVRAKGVLRDIDRGIKSLQVVGARVAVLPLAAGAPIGLVCFGARGRLDVAGIDRALRSSR